MELPVADGEVSIHPQEAQASEPHTWTVTYTVGKDVLKAGAHVALEIPDGWSLDLGRPIQMERMVVAAPGEGMIGRAALVTVQSSSRNVRTDLAVSAASRFYIVDVAICEGELGEGAQLRIVLGDPIGPKLRCQKFAQKAVLAFGVDVCGDGIYRRTRSHPTVRVIGGPADRLRVIGPAAVRKGDPFEVTVQAVDAYNLNPASGYEGEVRLSWFNAEGHVPERHTFRASDEGIAKVGGCVLNRGFGFVTAVDEERALIGRSAPICADFEGTDLYFGEIHGQMYESIGTGDVEEYYQWGRDVERLDFCATANHYGGRFDYGAAAKEDYRFVDRLWPGIVEASNRYDIPGEFVTFVSFEWGNRYGHKNVYYRSDEGPFIYGQGETSPEELWERLRDFEALTIPHHPKYCGLTDWSFRNDRMQRLVEICSAWGISETGGDRSVQRALAMGHRLGFIGGTDTHYGQPGHGPHGVDEGSGLAAVYAKERTREAIFDALYRRRCYATTGARMVLDFRVNGHAMGEEIDCEVQNGKWKMQNRNCKMRKIEGRAIGTRKIRKVEILRNNEVVYVREGAGFEVRFEWTDREDLRKLAIPPTFDGDVPFLFYYCRVTQEDRHIAWSSPVWLSSP